MSMQLNFLREIRESEARISAEIQLLQPDVCKRIKTTQNKVLVLSKDALEESPEQKAVRETIERLQLRLELLRNIRMNWHNFQLSLNSRKMHMRINQDAHLKHLIAFLETGKGIQEEGQKSDQTIIPPERELMVFEVQPTGAGKTGAFAIDIALMNVPSLILVPLDSLLDQTKRDLIKIGDIQEQDIGIVGGGSKEVGRKHIIATYAGHMTQMKKGNEYAHFVSKKCKLIICDEVHYSALGDRTQESILAADRDIDQQVLLDERVTIENLAQQTSVSSLKIGFTATPKGMRRNVQEYFPHFLGRVYHREMVDEGLVVPYRIVQCDGTILESEIERYITMEKEAELLNRERIYGKLAGEYSNALLLYKHATERQRDYPMRGISFCTNHAECENFVQEASKFNLRCKIVTGYEAKGRSGQKVIDEAVATLLSGECELLVTVEKLATGSKLLAVITSNCSGK
jgi:hypothetical protein